jgi:hypothetical protein
MSLLSALRNGLRRNRERKMPICLQCGTHAEGVTLLWTEATGRDERYCFSCERRYRLTHPNCTPHGGGGQVTNVTKMPAKTQHTMLCELCGNITVAKELYNGRLLCFACQARITEVAVRKEMDADIKTVTGGFDGRTFVGGTNGLITVPRRDGPRKWCCKCTDFKPEKGGAIVAGTRYAWMCGDCIEAEDEGDKMDWHVKLQIKGQEKNIEFFHWLMHKLDVDYEDGGYCDSAEICPNCGGWEWKNPRFKPSQIKKLSKLVGLRKLKVLYWGKAQSCHERTIEAMVKNAKRERVMV